MDEERQNQQEVSQTSKTSGLAIASLVLGILGMCTCVTAIPGLVLGIIALVQTGKHPDRLKGQGLAIAGTILSGIAMLFTPFLAAILLPVFARARDKAQQQSCLLNVKQLGTAMHMYLQDWDDTYPQAANWNEALAEYARPRKGTNLPFVCPVVKGTVPTYAMNDALSAEPESVVSDAAGLVMIYESTPGRNLADGASLLPDKPRHIGGYTVGFADGHVTMVPASETASLKFELEPPPSSKSKP